MESALMQRRFRGQLNKYFSTPNVYSINPEGFKMEHLVNKLSAAQYYSEKIEDAEVFIRKCISFINDNIKHEVDFGRAPFMRKILKIINRLKDVESIRLAEKVAVALDDYGRFYLPYGEYHGDFTFVNILCPGDYLIDFTPAYIHSPIVDIVKLKQEYKLGWSAFMINVGENYLKLIQMLREYVEHHFTFDTRLIEAMNLLRILPYANEQMTRMLHREINTLL